MIIKRKNHNLSTDHVRMLVGMCINGLISEAQYFFKLQMLLKGGNQ